MTTVFCLAEGNNATGNLMVLDAAMVVLESVHDPVVVVSLVGGDARSNMYLWPLLKKLVSKRLGGIEDTPHLAIDPGTDIATISHLKPCIWGLMPDITFRQGSTTVRLLFLVYQSLPLQHGTLVEDRLSKVFEKAATTLLTVCSGQLNIFCDQSDRGQAQLLRHLGRVLDGSKMAASHESMSLGSLVLWHKCLVVKPKSSSLSQHTCGTVARDGEQRLEALNTAFKEIKRKTTHQTEQDGGIDTEVILAKDLLDLTLPDHDPADAKGCTVAVSDFLDEALEEWSVRRLLRMRETMNGPILTQMLKGSLLQINTADPGSFDMETWRAALLIDIRTQALKIGTSAYHGIMNSHLDRQPLPVPWHNLVLIHQESQRLALEHIEKRYYTSECHLPELLKAFRALCLEPGPVESTVVGTLPAVDMIVSNGLYSEYYMANAHELHSHHMAILVEHWQLYVKSRLNHGPSTLPASLAPPTLVATRPTASQPDITTYAEFLQAVDNVRKNYLQICIPSPEAIAVLETMDEMQQAETILFQQNNHPKSQPHSPSEAFTRLHGSAQSVIGFGQSPAANSSSSLKSELPGASLDEEGTSQPDDLRSLLNARRGSSQQVQCQSVSLSLERQISEILQVRRARKQAYYGQLAAKNISAPQTQDELIAKKEPEKEAVVQFGWTLHLRHANTLQYAWIWSWFQNYEGLSYQNIVACDSKKYTSSKWMLLPAKDTVRSRKYWRVCYGDRVWLTSYWFSTRNVKMELPEYLPLARGGPCRHIVPYGETYVICKTCPADVICMRCFQASAHEDHLIYLQCSWGLSVCVCNDLERLGPRNLLHCSIHSAESQRTYSAHGKDTRCSAIFNAGDVVYHCKSCSLTESVKVTLCGRCFGSSHSEHEVSLSEADDNSSCVCGTILAPGKQLCVYHSEGSLDPEYQLQSTSASHSIVGMQNSHCRHSFKPGEDMYHCNYCSISDTVVLCSRCFHSSACVSHQWRVSSYGNVDYSEEPVKTTSGESQDTPLADTFCACGDQSLFKASFDCNYHLPSEFRPIPSLYYCNYLFRLGDVMYHCSTCYSRIHQTRSPPGVAEKEAGAGENRYEPTQDVWICRQCFDPKQHQGHQVIEVINKANVGYHCHCGDQSILSCPPKMASEKSPSQDSGGRLSSGFCCSNDHNRQNTLCSTSITEGMVYYDCKTCQTDPDRVLCEGCFVPEAHLGHDYYQSSAFNIKGVEPMRCACGENSAFRFATHCDLHESSGGTNIVQRCHYVARAGDWIAQFRNSYRERGSDADSTDPYLCLRCRQGSDHTDYDVTWVQITSDRASSCACGSYSLSTLSIRSSLSGSQVKEAASDIVQVPPLCKYHTMIYKTTPATTQYLHSHPDHQLESMHNADRAEVTGNKYHDNNNDWIVMHPDDVEGAMLCSLDISSIPASSKSATPSSSSRSNRKASRYLQWGDVIWLQHASTGRYLNSMFHLKVSQGFQAVSAFVGQDSNNAWLVEETTWLREHLDVDN